MSPEPRVLIVDDDVALAEVTCEILGMAGALAIYRTTVTDAIDALVRHSGSLAFLFTDINMASPMSGIELAIYAAQEWPAIAICVTSGFVAERPSRLPPNALFLPKPWHVPDLVAFVGGPTALRPV